MNICIDLNCFLKNLLFKVYYRVDESKEAAVKENSAEEVAAAVKEKLEAFVSVEDGNAGLRAE